MKIGSKEVLLVLAAILYGHAALAADQAKTTGVTMGNGQRVLVHTDAKGTLVTEYPSSRSLYSSGGNRHADAVKAYAGNGGKVGKTLNR